jgi:hypothetical protein
MRSRNHTAKAYLIAERSCRSAASRLHCDKSATEFSLAALTTSGAGGSVGGGSGDMAKTRKSDGVGGSGGGHLRA